jgi:hypothetical protein
VEPTIKRSFLGLFRPGTDGFGGSLLPAFFLFTIQEEIGISARRSIAHRRLHFSHRVSGQPHWLSGQESGWAQPVTALKFQRWNASPVTLAVVPTRQPRAPRMERQTRTNQAFFEIVSQLAGDRWLLHALQVTDFLARVTKLRV